MSTERLYLGTKKQNTMRTLFFLFAFGLTTICRAEFVYHDGICFVVNDGLSDVVTGYYVETSSHLQVWIEWENKLENKVNNSIILIEWDGKVGTRPNIPLEASYKDGYLCYASRNEVHTIDIKSGKRLWSLNSEIHIKDVNIYNNIVLIAMENGRIDIVDLISGSNVASSVALVKSIEKMYSSTQDKIVILMDKSNTIHIFDIENNYHLHHIDSLVNIAELVIRNRNEIVCSRFSSNEILLYDFRSRKEIKKHTSFVSYPEKIVAIYDCFEDRIAVELESQPANDDLRIVTISYLDILNGVHRDTTIKYVSHFISCENGFLKSVGSDDVGQNIRLCYESSFIDVTKPTITLISPVLTDSIYRTDREILIVKGTIHDERGINSVLINNETVIFNGGTGQFIHEILLNNNLNVLTIHATDNNENTTNFSFKIIKELPVNRGVVKSDVTAKSDGITNFNYHAFLIGEQDYLDKNVSDLSFPVRDVEHLKKVLTEKYSFDERDIILGINYTRNQIIHCFDSLLNVLTPADHLLIFYAGHGQYDSKLKQGYWLPVDADMSNKGTWVSNSDIRDFISGIETRHTLLISDACFSGSILDFSREVKFEKVVGKLLAKKARTAMTSGLDNPVPDESVFIKYLLEALTQNKEPFIRASELFESIKTPVMSNTDNIPQHGAIRNANHEGGEFIFLKKIQKN